MHSFILQLATKIAQTQDASGLLLLRLDFLRILCSHEHYFPLNLPLTGLMGSSAPSSPTPSSGSSASHSSYASTATLTDRGRAFELTPEFRQQHFLTGLVLSDLAIALDSP